MSYHVPSDLKYTREHEWVKIDGEGATIGITDYAQSSLGDVVFVELPEIGAVLQQGQTFGVVESIKSVSDLYTPISGTVREINQQLELSPELCNQAPYDSWMIKLDLTGDIPGDASLLSAQDYAKFCEEQI